MATTTKTPVEIIQDLIAIYTTRKEAADKLQGNRAGGSQLNELTAAAGQTDQFIAELLGELSNYGDAVLPATDRENDYQRIWNEKRASAESLDSEQAAKVFASMEESLRAYYKDILETKTSLPLSLQEILSRQQSLL